MLLYCFVSREGPLTLIWLLSWLLFLESSFLGLSLVVLFGLERDASSPNDYNNNKTEVRFQWHIEKSYQASPFFFRMFDVDKYIHHWLLNYAILSCGVVLFTFPQSRNLRIQFVKSFTLPLSRDGILAGPFPPPPPPPRVLKNVLYGRLGPEVQTLTLSSTFDTFDGENTPESKVSWRKLPGGGLKFMAFNISLIQLWIVDSGSTGTYHHHIHSTW